MIKIKFQTQELYSVQLKSLNILHSQGTCAFYLHNVQCIYFIQVTIIYLFWVLVDMIKDFLYQRNNNQLL